MDNKSLKELWQIICAEGGVGISRRLYSKKNEVRVFSIFQKPQNYYGIAFSFETTNKYDLKNLKQLEELQIDLGQDNAYSNSQLLTILLTDSNNLIVFNALCEDLIAQIEKIEDADESFRVVANQLNRWNNLFKRRRNKEGLDLKQQLGLYAELYMLKKLLTQTNIEFSRVVGLWVGPESAVRDFEYGLGALEVKATIANQPPISVINGERQLDETLLKNLCVFHIMLERKNGQEQTLPLLVNSIRDVLSIEVSSLELFDVKLFEAGYFMENVNLYEGVSYEVRKESYYEVHGDFPRIKESDLRMGVGGVKYILDFSACENYLISESDLFKKLISLWAN